MAWDRLQWPPHLKPLFGEAMHKLTIALITAAITCLASGSASARVRISAPHGGSHSSTHSTGHSSDHSTTISSISHGVSAAARNGDKSAPGEAGSAMPGTAGGNASTQVDDEHAKRIRQARDEAKAKADAEYAAVRKAQEAAAEEKRRAAAAEAAAAAAEAEKRAAAEERVRKIEAAKLEEKKRKAEWEGRCQIKGVMTDDEIAVCKEVLRSHLRS